MHSSSSLNLNPLGTQRSSETRLNKNDLEELTEAFLGPGGDQNGVEAIEIFVNDQVSNLKPVTQINDKRINKRALIETEVAKEKIKLKLSNKKADLINLEVLKTLPSKKKKEIERIFSEKQPTFEECQMTMRLLLGMDKKKIK